jgi:hypothetical protein
MSAFTTFKEIFETPKFKISAKRILAGFVAKLKKAISLTVIITDKENKLNEVLKEETPYGTKNYEQENGDVIND